MSLRRDKVHLRCDGVIIDGVTHATLQFSSSPIEIRFAPLVAASQPILDGSPQTFPTENCITAACQVVHRIAENCSFTDLLTQIHSIGVLGTEFLNDRFTHAAVDRKLLAIY